MHLLRPPVRLTSKRSTMVPCDVDLVDLVDVNVTNLRRLSTAGEKSESPPSVLPSLPPARPLSHGEAGGRRCPRAVFLGSATLLCDSFHQLVSVGNKQPTSRGGVRSVPSPPETAPTVRWKTSSRRRNTPDPHAVDDPMVVNIPRVPTSGSSPRATTCREAICRHRPPIEHNLHGVASPGPRTTPSTLRQVPATSSSSVHCGSVTTCSTIRRRDRRRPRTVPSVTFWSVR